MMDGQESGGGSAPAAAPAVAARRVELKTMHSQTVKFPAEDVGFVESTGDAICRVGLKSGASWAIAAAAADVEKAIGWTN